MISMIGSQIIELEAVDSTNNYALKLIREGIAKDGMVISAEYQWGGRGRSNKRWDSASGENLTCSVIMSPLYLHPGRQFLLSQAIALGICQFLEEQSPNAGSFSIKWPNDIYYGAAKICGILIENLIFGQEFRWSVAGIGINLNQTSFSPGIPNPASLRLISGRPIDTREALEGLLEALQRFVSLVEEGDYEAIESAYLERLYLRGKVSQFRAGAVLISGSITGVDEYGRLLVRIDDGTEHAYMMDDISLA
jgi:BirA family transcriptional regulator, biotin operon repressor / biotin---[acetyl-CoA-carboxylase] ligase